MRGDHLGPTSWVTVSCVATASSSTVEFKRAAGFARHRPGLVQVGVHEGLFRLGVGSATPTLAALALKSHKPHQSQALESIIQTGFA